MNLGPPDVLVRAWMTLPSELAVALLFIGGLIAGGFANHVITTWCWYPRPISPWVSLAAWKWNAEQQTILAKLPGRDWADRLPLIGWVRLRRESALHGRGFWVRPLLIELSLAIAMPVIYQSYVDGRLLPAGSPGPLINACMPWMTLLFFVHAVLLIIMIASTFIDFDERTIPDSLTIPGTLIAMSLSALTPYVFLPGLHLSPDAVQTGVSPVTFQHPMPLPNWWESNNGLILGWLIWTTWCFALSDRRVILRKGFSKAVEYFFARLVRHPSWKVLAAIWIAGMIAIGIVFRVGGLHWLGLLSSLCGLAVGGGIVWAIRLVGSWAMRMEAMGFGDVTLMAMIGSFLGWQASVAAFFLAPMAAILIVIVQFIVTRDRSTPFGPYLCAGTVLTVAFWDRVYNQNLRETVYLMGDVLLWIGVAILGLLGAMLWVWRMIKMRLIGDD